MAHEVETLMYTSNEANGRFKPWHSLGVSVEEAPTSADAIRIASLDWNVSSQPIYTDAQIEIPGYKANTRDSDNSVLGIVTDRYKIVQNQEAFDFTDALIGEGCKYETAGSLRNGKRIFLCAKMPERKVLGEDFDNYVVFTNSHDGCGAIQACMTPIRVVCQNTLNLALNGASRKWSTKHTGDMSSKLAEARYTLNMANEYLNKFEVTADQLAHTKVTDAEISILIDELFPIEEDFTDRRKQNVQEVKNQFMVCMIAPDILKYKNTAYQVVNAASDWATHAAPKRMTSTYAENNFSKVLDGHVVIDKVFEKMMLKVSK